jgi:6-pyruvoyltetrahydropterin/6-carboxytetrahydropterin synthase
MYRVMREIHFCYGHRLLNYEGKCRHLHGHNGRVAITLAADRLDAIGMVMDFSRIKEVVLAWIDENIDHKMLLSENDPLLPVLRHQGEPVYVMRANPTAENIARLIYDFAKGQGFPVTEVALWETDHCSATYSGQAD